MEETMDLEITRSGEASVLKLKGNWTVERAVELKPSLLEALNSSEHILINIEDLEEADLWPCSCSARRIANPSDWASSSRFRR